MAGPLQRRPNHNGQALEYIEATRGDIEQANRLAHEVLGRSMDELPPQTRKLLQLIKTMVDAECREQNLQQTDYRFSRKQIRQATGWGNTQLKIHCHRLEEMEYLLVHRGRRGQTIEYELLYDQQDEKARHLVGLIDPEHLRYDTNKSGINSNRSGSSRPQVGGVSGPSRTGENTENPVNTGLNDNIDIENAKTHYTGENTASSYRSVNADPLAAERAGGL